MVNGLQVEGEVVAAPVAWRATIRDTRRDHRPVIAAQTFATEREAWAWLAEHPAVVDAFRDTLRAAAQDGPSELTRTAGYGHYAVSRIRVAEVTR